MDNKLRELAKYYGIEVSNTPGAKIIDEDGTKRLATVDDIEAIFSIQDISKEKDFLREWFKQPIYNSNHNVSDYIRKIKDND